MLSILATGQARYNNSGLTNNLNFDNQSTIVGENAGKDLKIVSDTNIQKNFYNTFLGYQAGRFSIISSENIYIGFEAGIYLNGSNNIMIGKNYENGISDLSYNAISIGRLNKTFNNSVSIGTSNINTGITNILLGNDNNLLGDDNIAFGNLNNYKNINKSGFIGYNNTLLNINSTFLLGNDNKYSNLVSSMVLGNNNNINNCSNLLVIGNNNILSKTLSSNYIIIGNNLSNNANYLMNIGDTIFKYDNTSNNEILFLGLNNKYNSNYNSNYSLHIAVGFTETDIPNIDDWMINSNEWSSLYIKSGLNTDKITFSNYTSNIPNITLSAPTQIDESIIFTSNINYVLPLLPSDTCNVVLSTSNNGHLYWKNADILFSSIGDSLSKYTTDQIKQGTSNEYYTNSKAYLAARVQINDIFPNKFDEFYYPKLQTLNIDQIKNGTSNKYITNGVINQDIVIFGTLTVNKIQVLGTDIKNENSFNSYVTNIVSNTSNQLMNVIQTLMNRITYLESKIT